MIFSRANARRIAASLVRWIPPLDLGDLQLIVGLGALTYGVSLVSVPAAWITFGSFLLAGWLAPRLPRAKKG